MARQMTFQKYYVACAFAICGSMSLYWSLLPGVAEITVVAFRIVTTLFVYAAVALNGQGSLRLTRKDYALAALAGAVIGVNWLCFVYAVTLEKVTEFSLGTFSAPALSMMLGYWFFSEKASKLDFLSFAFVLLGIAVYALSMSNPPILGILVMLTTSVYFALKKVINGPASTVLLVETLTLLPVALVPLYLFGVGVKFTRMIEVGYLQYISPFLSLTLALLYFGEKITEVRMVAFGLIGLAVALRLQALRRKANPAPGITAKT
jgi:chloramphenicol-sensitive protein RarD